MFGLSPTARMAHLLTSVPIDLNIVALEVCGYSIDGPETPGSKVGERRYDLALKIATYTLSSSRGSEPETSDYIKRLIAHQARAIVLPRHLLPSTAVAAGDVPLLAEMFEVPEAVVTSRLADADLRDGLPMA